MYVFGSALYTCSQLLPGVMSWWARSHWLTAVLGSNITFRPVCLSTPIVIEHVVAIGKISNSYFSVASSDRYCWGPEMRSLSVLVEADYLAPLSACLWHQNINLLSCVPLVAQLQSLDFHPVSILDSFRWRSSGSSELAFICSGSWCLVDCIRVRWLISYFYHPIDYYN